MTLVSNCKLNRNCIQRWRDNRGPDTESRQTRENNRIVTRVSMAAVNITMENNRRKEKFRKSSIKCAENMSGTHREERRA